MKTQIRLAERQGLLTGTAISQVQSYALSVLDLIDQIAETDRKDRELRLAFMASGKYEADLLFKELATVVEDDAAELPAEVDSEGNAIKTKYVFSNATFDPKTVEAEIREMLERAAQSEASFETAQYDDWV